MQRGGALDVNHLDRSRRLRTRRRALGYTPLLLTALAMGGCHWDSFLDPSIVGRWERTATVVPILERISAIEEGQGQFVDYSDVAEEDLIPQVDLYVIGPGDTLQLTIFDLVTPGQPEIVQVLVDPNGYVVIPEMGRVFIAGLTEDQVRDRLIERSRVFTQFPSVSVVVAGRRAQTFTIQGAVAQPGLYQIPAADYRLLEALVSAGGFNEGSTPFIFVIRQVAIDERIDRVEPESPADQPARPPAGDRPTPPRDGDEFIDLIEGLIPRPPGQNPPSPPPSPGMIGAVGAVGEVGSASADNRGTARWVGVDDQPAPIIDLDGGIGRSSQPADRPATPTTPTPQPTPAQPTPAQPTPAQPTPAPAAQPSPDGPAPLVDLVEPRNPTVPVVAPTGGDAEGRWLFLNGEWVRTLPTSRGPGDDAAGGAETVEPVGEVVTQRVIRVPAAPLISGDAKFNIIVRPGDVVRIPPPLAGNIYVGGQVVRPGAYTLPPIGRLTLTRVITSAGGLSGLAIPERVDLTRMVAADRQATIMLNLRAITEGTQPDVFLKPDDHINIGTNFWATPLAVLRGGLRASYGFGFLLDRNFGNDVFGAPPLASPGG